MTGVEVTQEILSEEIIAILPVTAGVKVAQEIMSEEEKIHDTKKLKMIKTDKTKNIPINGIIIHHLMIDQLRIQSLSTLKKCQMIISHNKNKNEGKDLTALEEEVRYLREVIKQGKLREINEETGLSKKMEQGNSFRTSEEPSQDSSVNNITGPFNFIIPEDLLHLVRTQCW
ncbi:unnamed protein product [Rhizophagus irregularis]|nr:unnamed protein product [Rhizophagus irregularis]